MRHTSLWTETREIREFESLNVDKGTDNRTDVRTPVVVIGGGICGILCTYFLHRAGVDCLLVERDRIAGGITAGTTAKITAQHGLCYDRMLHSLGQERAALYLAANQKAVEQYRRLAGTVECDFEEKCSGVYSRRDGACIERELRAIEALGGTAEFVGELPLPFEIEGAVLMPGQAQFHPLKFIAGIADGLPVHEQTTVRKVEGNTVWTDRGKIIADQVIVATHFPFLNLRGSYFLKLYQQRSYVLALENAPDVAGMYIDEAPNGLSFRNAGKLLLVGGGGHRTGKAGGGWQELRDFADITYPDAREVSAWAAQDCMSLDGIPYIGRYSANTPNLYVASGFCKWGMTSSMVAAMLLCDMVSGRKNEFEEVFSPSRSMMKSQLLINGLEAVENLLTPTPRRCPHMGCALKWNAQEHTWDCPCHGSRFEENGELIDNPANRGLSSGA